MQEQVESYRQEDLEELEKELLKKIKTVRKMRGVNPIPSSEEMAEKKEILDVPYRRIDMEGKETSVMDDLASIGIRDVLANPSDPAAQVAFLKNLKQRPDIVQKVREGMINEEFLEKALIALSGAAVGFYARGALEKKFKGILDSNLL